MSDEKPTSVVKLAVSNKTPNRSGLSRQDGIAALEMAIEFLQEELANTRDPNYDKPMRGLVIAARYHDFTGGETSFGVNSVRYNLDALESIGLAETYIRFTQRNLFGDS